MNFPNKKKAFTLTELLVVVIVLGVLAGVAAPKFKRVLESRKTTEAENMLAAVRTEQEKRCIMGKRYFGRGKENKVDVLANAATSANYTYSLTDSGVDAKAGNYTLRIKSYKDGQICCEGVGCSALNKNYVSCDSITVAADECAAEVEAPVVEPEPEATCEPYSWTSSFDIGSGSTWGTCYTSHNVTCNDAHEAVENTYSNGCVCRDSNHVYNSSTHACEQREKEETCTPKVENGGTAGGMADTCDGDNSGQYTCDGVFKGTCNDVYVASLLGLSSAVNNASWWLPSDSFGSFQQGILLASGVDGCGSVGRACTYGTKTVCCPTGYTCEVQNLQPYCAKGSTPAGDPSLLTVEDTTPIPEIKPDWRDINTRGGTYYYYRKVTCCGTGGETSGSTPDPVVLQCNDSDKDSLSQTVTIANGSCSETRTATCNTSAGTWTYGNWVRGTCSCNTGSTWHAASQTCKLNSSGYTGGSSSGGGGFNPGCYYTDSQGHIHNDCVNLKQDNSATTVGGRADDEVVGIKVL